MQTLPQLFSRVRAVEHDKDPKSLNDLIIAIAMEMYNEVMEVVRNHPNRPRIVINTMNLAHSRWNDLASRWPDYFPKDGFAVIVKLGSAELHDVWQKLRSKGYTQMG